jgi:parvulin-like peptidyl-prolyl isomerase
VGRAACPRLDEFGHPKRGRHPRAEITRTIRIQQFIQEHLTKGFAPDPADVQKYYGEHAAEFSVPDRVQVREILVSSADHAERLLGLLRDSQYKNFAQLAKQFSTAPSGANGGDMGVFARGDLPEEMEKVFFNTLVPGRAQIIQTKYGYHLFLLVKREKAYSESLDAVRGRIAGLLLEQHQKRILADTIKQLRSEVPVVIYRENLDFSYNPSELSGGVKP